MRYLWLTLIATSTASATELPNVPASGRVQFISRTDDRVPQRYRLSEHEFTFEAKLRTTYPYSGTQLFDVQFPSAVKTLHLANNTVHAEYYRPAGVTGKIPAVLVLDILAGDQRLSRAVATYLAQNGIAAMCIHMPYYGPRRPPNSRIRLLSPDLPQTFEAVRQAVLDARRALAWLGDRPEVDRQRLGLMGTSLGGLLGALVAEMEPAANRIVLALGGGGLVDAFYDDPRVAPIRKTYEAFGGGKQTIRNLIAPMDPITCAANLKGRQVLMIAASQDEIIPPKAARQLWEAAGQPKILWVDAGHYTAILALPWILERVKEHLTAEDKP